MGLIRDDDIQEVRDRNNIVEVIGEYVPLKKAGRTFKANCPFHNEKTPSFVVDPAKQLYHCFGCGEGGTVFTFVMKMDKVDFPDAVRSLADRAGYVLSFEDSARARHRASVNKSLYAACEAATEYFSDQLKAVVGQEAGEYLEKRELGGSALTDFAVGFAPAGWDNLLRFLVRKGFKEDVLSKAGLVAAKPGGSYYDRFRERIMFPIRDLKGRTVAFGGRALKYPAAGRNDPKYLNSPETPLYNKSAVLYGLFEGRSGITKSKRVRVVEGYTDVIALYQAGQRDAVATMGTAFTLEHLRLASRFAPRVEFVFDADSAGDKAAERGLALLGEAQTDMRVVSLAQGEDPADFVTKRGSAAFERLSAESVPLVEFCINQAIRRHAITDPQGRAQAATDALKIIKLLKNAVAQEQYVRRLAERLSVGVESLVVELSRVAEPGVGRRASKAAPVSDAQFKAEKELLGFVVNAPDEAGVLDHLSADHFVFPDH
ncbi:MAG: DNA primase, partial [Terriglobia bacterium]